MSTQTAFVFLVLAFAAVYSLEDGLAFATSAKGRKLKFVEDNVSPVYLPLLNAERDPAAGPFKIIGEVAMGKPCCTSWGPDRVDCFIRGEDSNILHWWRENGKATDDWEDLGGHMISGPECVSRTSGTIDVLSTGTDSSLNIKTYNDGKWADWVNKGQVLMEQPSCAVLSATEIHCMVRNNKLEALFLDQVDGKWGEWISKPIEGAMMGPGKTHVRSTTTNYWYVGLESNLYEDHRRSTWSKFKSYGGSVKGQPEAVSVNSRRTDAVLPGTKNQLMHLRWTGSWQPWKDLGGKLVDTPSCVVLGTIVQCFMVQSDSYLYRRYYDGKVWSDWFCAYGSFVDSPKCVVSNAEKKEVVCYLRGFNRKVNEVVYNL